MNTALQAALSGHYTQLTDAAPGSGAARVRIGEPDFRAVMGALPTGVSIVTVPTDDGVWGMTVGSLTSLSLQPPLVLVCLRRSSATLDLLARHGRFALSVLADGQGHIADTFARPRDHHPRHASTFDGLPVIADALAWLTCAHEHTYTSGDHAIVIGAVRDGRHRPGPPLVRHASRYHTLTRTLTP